MMIQILDANSRSCPTMIKKGITPEKRKIAVSLINVSIIRSSFLVVTDASSLLLSGVPQVGQYEASSGIFVPHLMQIDIQPIPKQTCQLAPMKWCYHKGQTFSLRKQLHSGSVITSEMNVKNFSHALFPCTDSFLVLSFQGTIPTMFLRTQKKCGGGLDLAPHPPSQLIF